MDGNCNAPAGQGGCGVPSPSTDDLLRQVLTEVAALRQELAFIRQQVASSDGLLRVAPVV